MRDVIGSILIILSLIAFVTAIVGAISPEKFAVEGQPAPTRAGNFFAAFFLTVVLLVIGLFVLPSHSNSDAESAEDSASSTAKVKATDVELVQSVFKEIRDIEDLASDEQKKLSNELISLVKNKQNRTADKSDVLRELVENVQIALDKSSHITVPNLANEDAKRHLIEAVDTHKKWSVIQQAKLELFTRGDMDAATKMAEKAARLAEQEALAMTLAFKAVGAPIP